MGGFTKVIEKIKRLVRKLRKSRNLAADFSNAQLLLDLPKASLKKVSFKLIAIIAIIQSFSASMYVGILSILCSNVSMKIRTQSLYY